jgi:hypothetical protein
MMRGVLHEKKTLLKMTKKQVHFSFLVIFGQFRLLHGKKGTKTLEF